jgi:hypothetical protein
LQGLVASAGFELETMLEFNRIGVVAWWLNGRVLRRRTFGLSQIEILNVMTPIFRAIDKLLPLPPLSLIAVIKKNLSAEPPSALFAPGLDSAVSQRSATGLNE